MPNLIKNAIQPTLPEDMEKLKKLILNEKGEVDFNILVPETSNPDDPSYDWYQWRLDNWGCKWNAVDTGTGSYNDGEYITFSTPWACPDRWYKELSKHISFSAIFSDEDMGVNVGDVDGSDKQCTIYYSEDDEYYALAYSYYIWYENEGGSVIEDFIRELKEYGDCGASLERHEKALEIFNKTYR